MNARRTLLKAAAALPWRDRWRCTAWLWQTGRGHRLQALLNTSLGVASVLTALLFVWATKLTVDIATHADHRLTLTQALALLAGLALVEILLGVASRWVRALLGVKAQNALRATLFAHLLRCEWQGLKAYHSGDLLNRMEKDASAVVTYLTESLPQLVTTLVQFAGAFLFLFALDRALALLVVALLPVVFVVSRLYVRRMKALTHRIRTTESTIQSLVQESVQHALVIKTLERSPAVLGHLAVRQDELRREVRERTRYATTSSTVMNVGFAAGYLLTFAWGVVSLEEGAITYGALMAFIQLVGQIQGPARSLTRFVPVIVGAYTAAERLMEIERVEEEQTNGVPRPVDLPVGIRLNDVTFAYTPGGRTVFRNFDFDFAPGSRTAVVGETGVGKTTLVRLLLGLVHPTGGTITLYGPRGETPVSPTTRSYFAYVPQGNSLLSGTVRSNLLMGDPEADEAAMFRALHAAGADFVRALPAGLDTRCGEQGDGLSEGQAQRICIARTLLRKASVMVFDEATSALDSTTEETVVRRIVALFPRQTLIFITHRPAVLAYCTRQLRLSRTPDSDTATKASRT